MQTWSCRDPTPLTDGLRGAQGPPKDRIAMPLLVAMAQQRRRIARDMEVPHLKLIAELYDKCEVVLIQARRLPCAVLTSGSMIGLQEGSWTVEGLLGAHVRMLGFFTLQGN